MAICVVNSYRWLLCTSVQESKNAFYFAEARFRENLLLMEKQNTELNAKVQEMESKLGSVNTDTSKMQRKIRSLEKANDVLIRTNTVYEHERRQLEKEASWLFYV